LNPGFKVYKFLYHNHNRNGIIKLQLLKTPIEINNYVNKLTEGQVIIHYRLNNTPYIDIINIDIRKKYDIQNSLQMIRSKNNKTICNDLISACSISISNTATINDTLDTRNIIFDEEDITEFFLSIIHNSIAEPLYVEDIWAMYYTSSNRNIKFKDNYKIQVNVIDNNFNIIQLNNTDSIQIKKEGDKNVIIGVKNMEPSGSSPVVF